jgi:hypothetical protein
MRFKPRDVSDFAASPSPEENQPEQQTIQNSFPRVLGGRPLQQLELPPKFLSAAKITGPVKPSNFMEVRECHKTKTSKPD